MKELKIELSEGKRIYFASDFHLGAPNKSESFKRELRIIKWMDQIKDSAAGIFLVGDLFDFWHEYKKVIPKGFVRFQAKIAALTDSNIPVYIFTGNHDLWMQDYFKEELGAEVFKAPIQLQVNDQKILVGHGDGLGPGDYQYKFLKKVFQNRMCKWLFRQIHPDLGIRIANGWSTHSRISSSSAETDQFLGDGEWLLAYAKETEKEYHFDYYIFGHRHLPIDEQVNEKARYINLGEWVHYNTYASFDGKKFVLEKFDEHIK